MSLIENPRTGIPGLPVLLAIIVGFVVSILLFIGADASDSAVLGILGVLILIASIIDMPGLFVVEPNEGRVLILFGKYRGTVRTSGWHWVNPFHVKKRVSLRIRNFETEHLKVNDLDGNPVEIAAVVVWRVVDTAEAIFEVDDYVNYVHVQSESALRNMATHYPYDTHHEERDSLRGSTDKVAEKLNAEIQARLQKAGVEVIEARITHLAYAAEIASAMLQRQQAAAIIAARTKIVEGAVSMVQMALERLAQDKIVELDEERKAAMVSNLLVVLCGEHGTQPVVNTGTLYT